MADNGRRGTALCPLTVGQAAVLVRVFSVLVGNNDALAGMAVAKDPLPTEPRPAFVARHPYFEPQQHPIVIDCHLEGQGERPPLPPSLVNWPSRWVSPTRPPCGAPAVPTTDRDPSPCHGPEWTTSVSPWRNPIWGRGKPGGPPPGNSAKKAS